MHLPDACVCQTLPGGEKLGWIYATHYTDGTEIPEKRGNGSINPDWGRAQRCACGRAKDADNLALFLRQAAHLPAGEWTFADYRSESPEQQAAKETCVIYSSGRTNYRWLLLTGNIGVGKTHLCCAMVSALIGMRVHARYEYVPDLIDELRAGQMDGAYEERIAQLRACEVVILDDLGAAPMTDWGRGEVLKLIDWRYRERASLVVTTNVTLDQLEPRVVDRLVDRYLSKVVVMNWASYRTGVRL